MKESMTFKRMTISGALAVAAMALIVSNEVRLRGLCAQQSQLSAQLAAEQEATASLARELMSTRNRFKRDSTRRAATSRIVSDPAMGQWSDESPYVLVDKKRLAFLGSVPAVQPNLELTPAIVEVLGLRPEEVVLINQRLARYVADLRAVHNAHVAVTNQRTLGDWAPSDELIRREFKSFDCSLRARERHDLERLFTKEVDQLIGIERAHGLYLDAFPRSLGNDSVLNSGRAGLVTLVKPTTPQDPIWVHVLPRGPMLFGSKCVTELNAPPPYTIQLRTTDLWMLPDVMRQVIEGWWDVGQHELQQR